VNGHTIAGRTNAGHMNTGRTIAGRTSTGHANTVNTARKAR
jgi:hypothetical protein